MLTTTVGDILEVKEGIICHQVNCQGVMGAGLALYIRDRWSIVFDDYLERLKRKEESLGDTVFSKVEEKLFVASIFGQYDYGRKGVYTKYLSLKSGLEKVEKMAKENDLEVFIPYKIGSGLAGGDWRVVLGILKEVFENSLVKATILVYTGNS